MQTVSVLLLASEILASPVLLPGDPRLSGHALKHHDEHAHGDHDHGDHDHGGQAHEARVESAQGLTANAAGGYSFGYELSDGSFSYASVPKADASVLGGFGYKTADGGEVNVQYTAGVEGYRPIGDNLRTLEEVQQGGN